MKNYYDSGLALLRIGFSLAMLSHGYGKLLKLIEGGEIQFMDFMGIGTTLSLALAVIGEFAAPVFVALGLYTRWAALPTAFTMAVAFFYVHASDAFADKEMPFLFLLAFLAIALLGPGKYSLDALRAGKKS
ncbi:MAG: DoxX family protein [Bacteroidia bacterium]|nr:DoxX family protein [Bacteroidia bacterium]